MKDRNIAELTFRQNHFQSPDWRFASLWNKIEGIIPADYKEKLDNFINNIEIIFNDFFYFLIAYISYSDIPKYLGLFHFQFCYFIAPFYSFL